MSSGSRLEIWDFLDLFFLKLAKFGRSKLSSPQTDKDFYEDFFTTNDEEVMSSGLELRRELRADVLRDGIEHALENPGVPNRIIDVGCGTGDNLQYLIDRDGEFHGLEYSTRTADMAMRMVGDRAKIQVGSVNAMPYPDEFFDAALCIEVLEHVHDDAGGIEEIFRVLKPGAGLVISLPYRYWFKYYESSMGHYRHYTRLDTEASLRAAGFSIERHLPNFPRWSRYANYAYIFARALALLVSMIPGHKKVTAVQVRLPFTKEPVLAHIFRVLQPIRDREAQMNYSLLETSTFVLARKPALNTSA